MYIKVWHRKTIHSLRTDTMITIKYGRRPVCMGDDASNGIYTIEMPDEALLGDLIGVNRSLLWA